MQFEYQNPTRLVFGAGALSRLGEMAGKYGKRALLVTGGGSVKRNGTFDRALKCLKDAGISVYECEGVEPNPRITSVNRGAAIARKNDCDLVIALGGGSVMDAAKVMAAAVFYAGDPWDKIFHGQPEPHIPTRALPLITVPTLAATGSEMNCGAVISNEETNRRSPLSRQTASTPRWLSSTPN
jgi:alcohol dehydrogenase YqhD (iron-dependent ADH family)